MDRTHSVDRTPIVDYLVLDEPPHLVVHECTACKARYFDRRNACAACGRTEFTRADVERDGTLRAFTIVNVAADGVPVPYVAAIADCAGTAVQGLVVNTAPDPAHVWLGMKLRLTTFPIGTDAAGVQAISYGFEPAEEGDGND
ncbi:Zn-ribbon domain-containing OB-fold protein [Streptomyces sp. NPDC057137]|uniref:Zn-ribbon domain-containing OB-fold protein n=1 Tax=Streptomyces TaxID=1883 RepID=UPI00344A41B2